MNEEIELSLFDLLEKAAELLKNVETIDDEDEQTLAYHEIETCLEQFIENFFIQFFNIGFEIEIEGLTDEDFSMIENSFPQYDCNPPKNMINCFESAKETVMDIETAVYLDPPREIDLHKAYLNFLPSLFESFKKDKEEIVGHIENYGKIAMRMDGINAKIEAFKKQQNLDN